jgi:hypothetical protein
MKIKLCYLFVVLAHDRTTRFASLPGTFIPIKQGQKNAKNLALLR